MRAATAVGVRTARRERVVGAVENSLSRGELLNAVVQGIDDVYIALGVRCDIARELELSVARAAAPPAADVCAIGRVLLYPVHPRIYDIHSRAGDRDTRRIVKVQLVDTRDSPRKD